ncbi:MAG: sulfatase-like hydrolase/transferase, partial [Bacteroidota bacterium]
MVFFGLIGFFMFFPNKKKVLALIVLGIVIGWILSKYFKKIIVFQIILALISIISFTPKLIFHLNFDNASWATITKEEQQTKFIETPNIFVIQPDGYVNFSEIDKPPYDFDNSKFENWLVSQGFRDYEGFRSNYYSTYTSNSSMFAMQHHYYSNTNKATLKTHKANEVIIGKKNNVTNILKQNGYNNYLITDNTYFLINREPMHYDYCNVKPSMVSYHRSGVLPKLDFMDGFEKTLDTITTDKNFFFIERTIPGHIIYKKGLSKGKEEERLLYLDALKRTNQWLKEMISSITSFDENALIVIVADHGGYVGLDYTMEVTERKPNELEVISSFSSILSIKWPESLKTNDLIFKSNVNLFRKLFFALSKNAHLVNNLKENSSYLPLKISGETDFYEYIDDSGKPVFNKVYN